MSRAPLLADRLKQVPHRFEALHALRLVELSAARFGAEGRPAEEGARIAAATGTAFASAPLRHIEEGRVTAAFLGLTGPLGVLPQVYTEIVQQAARQRNRAMAAFLDLFNHRLVGLFLRAGTKYRLSALLQRSAARQDSAPDPAPDPVTSAVFALTGLGTPALRGRMAVSDEVMLYYAGLFAMRNRPASGLQAIVADYLGTAVTVEQFSGRWTKLPPEEQTRMPRAGEAPGFCRLGIDTVAGDRVWDVQGNIRIVIGPVDTEQMLSLAPDAPHLHSLVDLVRAYIGPDLGFDIQVILRRDCVPDLRFDPALGPSAPRLGWNSWAKSLPALEDRRDILIDPDQLTRPHPATMERT